MSNPISKHGSWLRAAVGHYQLKLHLCYDMTELFLT